MNREADPGGMPLLSGTPNQIEWAERIRERVHDEFDRVAATFHAVAAKQDAAARADTEAIISILEEKRKEVMRRDQAGYFIHDWQEITDQVRQLIFHDTGYAPIRERQEARRKPPGPVAARTLSAESC